MENEILNSKWGKAKIYSNGYYWITSRKEGNNSKLLHRLIFEEFYGKIPDGCHIHHKDGNTLNNCIMNLQLLTKREHISLHNKKRIGEKHPDFSGENNPRWKNYARIIKTGFNSDGKQDYAIKYKGKRIKRSINKEKLEKICNEINKGVV